MTTELPANPASGGVCSLEVRWILPGQLATSVLGWFARFPTRTESREDAYLLDPQLRGLSVKVRGGATLEVKAYRGSPGILDITGRARGRLLSWQKWSFPFGRLSDDRTDSAGWTTVLKGRRMSQFSLTSGPIATRGAGLIQELGCEVELTEVGIGGQRWWTLGFEATGPADLLRNEVEATAAAVFARAMPDAMKLGPNESRSYAEWLGQMPDREE
jgi:hypothetical protein